jgi:uncharacterized protein YcbK (DUF882 family)
MGDLTRNFNLSEFRCKDGTGVPPEYLCNVRVLATNLQVIRAKIGQPLVIVSGYRTPEHNRTCGGATNSYHLTAQAADIRCGGLDAVELHAVIRDLIASGYVHDGGLGLYDTFVHYDIRGTKARWDERKNKDTK